MFKGGDIQRNIIRLQNLLRQTKYIDIPSSQILSSGTPEIYLPIIHHTLFIFSPLVAKFLSDKNYDMYAKSDLDFINTVFICLIKLFNYKPLINTNQFFSPGFAEAKIIFCSDIAEIIINKHKELNKNYLPPKPNKNSNNNNNNSFNNNNNFNISNQSNNNTLNNTFNNTLNNNNNFHNHSFNNNNYNNSPERYNDDKNSLNDSFNREKDIPPSPKFHSVDDSTEKNEIKNSKKKNNNILESSQEIFSIPIPTPSIQKINQFNQSNQLEIYDSSSDFPLGGKTVFDSSSLNNSIKPNFNNNNDFNNTNNNNSFNNNINSNVMSINNSIMKNNNQIDFNTLVQVITSLSGSVSQMVNKIEKFKSNVDERLNKMEAEIALIKNRQNIIESQINKNNLSLNNNNNNIHINNNNNNSNNSINNNFSYNSNNSYGNNNINSETNEQMFSFACDDIKTRHFDNKKNIENIIYMNNNIIEEEQSNDKNFNTYSYTNTINNMNNNNSIQTNIGNLTYNNTISNQKYSDTDKLIENVEKKFQETKKLLNQFN